MHGRVERTSITSRLLQGNVLGDPHERELIVYLPPPYDGTQRFPVAMVLPGFASTNRSLLNFEVFQPNLCERFDAMIARGACPPAILVLPDAMNRWGGSQYLDSPATGPYQSYLADEVIPFVDARYRTIPRREARAVVGKSSGGFGAWRLGLDRPDVFSAIGSHAGDCAFELSMIPELRSAAIRLSRAGSVEAFVRDFPPTVGLGSGDFDTIMMIACGAAYAPDMSIAFPHVRLPIDIHTGALIESVWEQWRAHDPWLRVERDDHAFSTMRMLFIDAGDRDEHGLQLGARRIAATLSARGLPLVHEEFPGGHRNTAHRYERSLPTLIAALERD